MGPATIHHQNFMHADLEPYVKYEAPVRALLGILSVA